MATPEQLIAEARTWIDTPFHWHQRNKGQGCDCGGLVLGVLHTLGLSDWDCLDYTTNPDPVQFLANIETICTLSTDPAPGKLLVLRFPKKIKHCGICTDSEGGLGVIHTYLSVGKVVEHSLDEYWLDLVAGVYDLPGVNHG